MSALSFKITTDTAKINNFRKSLERLYELLEKFPSKSSGFKVINRHISDLETRVDQAIRKIAKMQQQAAESAAKVATPATPTATPSNSKTTSGSQTAQAEAAAYKDLIGTIREASAQKKIYTAQIELLKTKTQALTAEYNALSKAEKEQRRSLAGTKGQTAGPFAVYCQKQRRTGAISRNPEEHYQDRAIRRGIH